MLFHVLIVSVFSVAAFGLSVTGKPTLPVTTCKRDSADRSACLKRAVENAWPRFIRGLPEFDFPPLDPLFYEYGKAVFNSGEIHAEAILSNTTAVGLSKARFNDVRFHFLDDVFHLEVDTQTPRILIEGAVKINGSLGVFRIAGKGPFKVTADDVRATWNLIGHVVNDTFIVEHFRTFPSVKKIKVYFENLFQGNKELNDLAVIFVNEFWPQLYRVMLPIVSDVWDPWITGIANKIFLKVPFSKVFP